MKKFLKIFGIILGTILLVLLLTPIIFEKQLKDLVQKNINESFNAEVAFADIDLSFIRNFPHATLGIADLSIINRAPFEGDTLAFSEEIVLEMSVMELFRDSGKPLRVDRITIDNTLLNIKVDSLGNNNYDIAIQDTTTTGTSGGGFQFDLKHYEINDSRLNYRDENAQVALLVDDLNHEGNGDLSAEKSTLSTFSTALVSLIVDDITYLNKNKVQLDADFMMDLTNQKYSFLENQALVNQLPLTFDGYVQVNEDNNEVDIRFKTPTSSFKNFLAVIPEDYSKNIEDVQTSGDFVVDGFLKGIVDDTYIPKMEINMASNNASFKYPDLPKSVEDIRIAAKVINTTGLAEDTYMDIQQLNFRIDEDTFSANGDLRNLTENMLVNMAVKGTIDLANLDQAYPLELEQDLQGSVTADMSTRFDMESIEKERYQNVQSSGTATISDFSYRSPEIPNELRIASATMDFNAGDVSLRNFTALTGESDLRVNGTIQNLMGYLFTEQNLKGNFTARSETFSVNDFMVREEPAEETETAVAETASAEEDAIKIPSFLDVNLDFSADKVLYDNLTLNNTQGSLRISDETATLNNVNAQIFNGRITLNGSVSTGQTTPIFDMQLDLNAIDIAQAFQDMELLRNLAPIAQALQGNLNTNIELSGNLNKNLTPQLQTLAGDALAEVIGARVNPAETPLLANLDQSLNFVDLNNLNLKDLKTQLRFDNGEVAVQPFDFNIKGIKATASGTHGFDMEMNYQVALAVPASYLGSELGATLSRLSATARDTTTVSLPVQITGSFNDPAINLNMEQAVNNLTQRIIQSQTEQLKEKGKDVLTDILTGRTQKDTSGTEKDTIGTESDTIRTKEDAVKKAARDILGGLLGDKKKKKDTTDQ